MELLVFDVSARMAHFRKVYSTSTSLSYFFPPRTTISGLVASILGIERDSYYDEFSSKKCRVAVRILSQLRKAVLPVNYLNLDEISETTLRGLKKKDPRVPTSIEFVVPEPPARSVAYRVFIHHENLMSELERRLRERRFAYPPCLGPAYCLAEVLPHEPPKIEAELTSPPQEPIKVSTVIKESEIVSFPQGVRVCWESRVPAAFSSGRKIHSINNYICQPEGKPVEVKLRGEIFSCEGLQRGTYGTFME